MLGDARLEPVTLDLGASKFDLTLFVTEREGAIEIAVEYRADRFDEVWMRGLLGHYETLLAHLPAEMARQVAEVPMLSAAEETRLREMRVGATARGAGGRSAAAADSRSRAVSSRRHWRRPAATAGRPMANSSAAARAIAVHLVDSGVRPDGRVGIFLERSVAAVAAILGTHLAAPPTCLWIPPTPRRATATCWPTRMSRRC